jgi:hypothetical protein
MSLNDAFRRLNGLNYYIQNKCTGSRSELAAKLEISVSTLQEYINFMKDFLEAPIVYDHYRKSYVYQEDGGLDFAFQRKRDNKLDQEFYEYLQKFLSDRELRFKRKIF